jgi:hypothetical protein
MREAAVYIKSGATDGTFGIAELEPRASPYFPFLRLISMLRRLIF